jgi:hypothetical protein
VQKHTSITDKIEVDHGQDPIRSRTRSESIEDKITHDQGQDPIRSWARSKSIEDKIGMDQGQDPSRSRTRSEWITHRIQVDQGQESSHSRARSLSIVGRNRTDPAPDPSHSRAGMTPIPPFVLCLPSPLSAFQVSAFQLFTHPADSSPNPRPPYFNVQRSVFDVRCSVLDPPPSVRANIERSTLNIEL